jgi:hypothetical protein
MDYVIDTNYLRAPELANALQTSAASDRFILTDTAVLETMKNAQWELTARRSFQIIAQHPAKVSVAEAPGYLLANELQSGNEAAAIIDEPLSRGFRALLAELASGTDGPGMAFARANVAAAQADLSRGQQNHAANLQGLRLAYNDVRQSMRIPAYRAIADAAQKELVRLHRIKTLAQSALKRLVELEGKPAEVGNALADGRGILLRYNIGLYCLGFKWAVNHGLDSFPAERATNELMDLDHALLATYFDDILTRETSVRELRCDILQVLDSNIQFAPTSPATP